MGQISAPRDSTSDRDAPAPVLKVVRDAEPRPAPAHTLRFGDFELATESGELERGGQPVKLQPQPARLLQYLAERPGQAVSRRELQVHLWGENRYVDSEQGLNYCVKSIRRALGDRAESPTYVETIPRRGYRFRAPVEVVDGPRVREAPPPAAAPRRGAGRRLPGIAAALVAVAVALGGAAWQMLDRERPRRLAVLPFENLSQRAADQPLVSGLTAELISRLVRAHGSELGVIAQTSTRRYADAPKPVAEIGAELDVDLLLTGTFDRAGEGLRISAQLIEVADGTVRWADVTEHGDPTAWTAEVSAAVAENLGLRPAAAAIPAFELPAELYEVYLQGVAFSNLETDEGVRQGLATLAEVRRRAPGFAPAHLAWARLRARTGPAREFLPEVMAALERAVALDPEFAEAHLEITRLRGLYFYEWRRGAEHARRALELRPRLADAHVVQAMYLAASGSVDEAVAAMHRALAIDPLSRSTSAHLAWSYFFARRFADAIEVSRRTLELDPTSAAAHATIIHSLLQLGDADAALAHAREAAGRDFADLEGYWRSEIEGGASSGVLAVWQTQLGDHEAALDSLERACREQVGWPLPFLRVDARFDGLRPHPRFADVLECAGLAD